MRKLACIIVLSVLITLACSADVEKFKKAAREWMSSHRDALEIFERQDVLFAYFSNVTGNASCASFVSSQFDYETYRAADHYEADPSKLGSIVMDLITVVYPPIFAKFRSCTNPDLFRRDEKNFNDATTQVLEQNPYMNKTYNDFGDEIGFLTKGQLSTNKTCVQIVANFVEFHRLSAIAEFIKKSDAYSVIAKLVYVKTSNFTKMAQKCLVGSDFDNFNAAFYYWFDKNPSQKAIYDQQDDMIGSLTKTFSHDEQCVKKIADDMDAKLKAAYASFGNGDSTISELATKFLYVSIPQGINEAKACLKIDAYDKEDTIRDTTWSL